MAIDTTKVKAQILRWKNNIASVYTELDNKVDKVSGKGLSTNDYTTTEKNKLAGIEAGAQANPYSKTQLDNKFNDKVDKDFTSLPNQATPLLTDVMVLNRGTVAQKVTLGNVLAQVNNEIFVVVATLPATGVVNKIYLVPKGTPEGQNAYDEYIWVNGAWEKLGTIALDLSNIYNKTEVNGLLSAKVDKNANITAGTKAKITYDSKGLVTSGADLEESDIPPLSASKITQTTTAKFVSDTEKSTWNGKQDKLVAGDNISIIDNTISASCGGDAYLANTQTFTGVNTFTQNVNLNRNMSSLSDPALTFNIGQNGIARIRVKPEGNPEQQQTTFGLIPTYLGGDETLLHTGNVKTINGNSLLGSGNIATLAIGETSSTAGRGDWTKTAHDHTFLTNNPHSVTKADVGLGSVQNYAIASKTQAESGTSNELYMTPLRTKELITVVMGDIESALDAILGV